MHRSAAPNEDEKSRLKGVGGVVGVFEDATADAQHHRTVTAHQLREGGLFAAHQEEVEQLPVRQAAGPALRHGFAELLDDSVPSRRRHAVRPHASSLVAPYILAGDGRVDPLFSDNRLVGLGYGAPR